MKEGFKFLLAVFAVLIVVLYMGAVYYGVEYLTAAPRGMANAENQIESAPNRITSYNQFFDLCASIKSYETSLQAQKEELKQSTSEDDKSRIRANISGLKAQRARAINQYNANISKSYTTGRFVGKGLPHHIFQSNMDTTCSN